MFPAFYAAIRRIPRGKVATYGSVARSAGYPGSARQVVWALHSARVPLPWHRVLGAGGKILLRGQHGLEQVLRLKNEKVKFRGSCVDMATFEFKFPQPKAKKSKARKKINP